MFGGPVSASNSPHLRKSGSRPVVFDLGEKRVFIMQFILLSPSNFAFLTNSLHCTIKRSLLTYSGASEVVPSAEGDILLSESNEMKGVTTPLTTAAILPSPVLLWRFKVLQNFESGFFLKKFNVLI